VALVTDESDLGTPVDEPSLEDFEEAEHEEPQAGARVVLFRILRTVGVVLVVLALVVYFAVPVSSFFVHVTHDWQRPSTGIHAIPVAPEPTSSPETSV
jgi:hypothetical protein